MSGTVAVHTAMLLPKFATLVAVHTAMLLSKSATHASGKHCTVCLLFLLSALLFCIVLTVQVLALGDSLLSDDSQCTG